MSQSVFPGPGGASYSLKATYTSAGAVTIPAGRSFVYAAIGSSETAVTAAGWVPADTSYTSANSLFYYSFLVGTGPNLYIYY